MLWIKKESDRTATVYLDDRYTEILGIYEKIDSQYDFFDTHRGAKLITALDNRLGYDGFNYDICPVTIIEKKRLMKKGLPGWRIMYKILIEENDSNNINIKKEKESV